MILLIAFSFAVNVFGECDNADSIFEYEKDTILTSNYEKVYTLMENFTNINSQMFDTIIPAIEYFSFYAA